MSDTAPESSPPDHVLHWHYARRQLLIDSDPERIEAHARDQLGRAINIGNLVAFAGSGLSMTYGRLSWVGLVEEMVRRAFDTAEWLIRTTIPDDKRYEIEKAKQGLNRLGFDGKKIPRDLGSESLPLAFEQCEVLWETLRRAKPTNFTKKNDEKSWKERGLVWSMRHIVADLLRDDRGHAEVMIGSLARDWAGEAKNMLRALQSLKPRYQGKERDWRKLFTGKALNEIIKEIPGGSAATVPFLNLDRPFVSTAFLQPVHRFLPLALLRLVEPCKRLKVLKEIQDIKLDDPKQYQADLQRYDVISSTRDPLAILSNNLNIRRFLTTNYDLDIERFLGDAQYERKLDAGGQTLGLSPLGYRSRDFVVDSPFSAHLLEFALRDRGGRIDIAHLHGSVDEPDNLVVTTEDYRKRYYAPDGDRGIVGDALSLVFDSNPVLFVGNGVSEDDLRRPMRHFLSDNTPRARTLIALLPAHDSELKETLKKVELLKNYGVYAIHYGRTELENNKKVRWLELVNALIKDLRTWFDQKNDEAKEFRVPPEPKGEGGKPAEPKKDTSWLCLIANPNASPRQLKPVDTLDGVSLTDVGLSLTLEIDLLAFVLNHAIARSSKLPEDPIKNACIAILDGVKDAITSTALCCALRRLELDWADWKTRWYSLPTPRSAGGPSQIFKNGQVLHHRHRVDLRDKPNESESADSTVPPGDRFFAQAPSHPFDALFEALEDAAADPRSLLARKADTAGRRLFVLHARRGVGKGHFFRLLSEEKRCQEFQQKSWPTDGQAQYTASAFINFGFSLEVASAFDRITDILVEQAPEVFGRTVSETASDHPVVKIMDAYISLRKNRIARLERIIALYSDHRQKADKKRVLIAINSFQIMFDIKGEPKNAQLRRLIAALLGKHGHKAPIDFVLVTREPGFPGIFRRQSWSKPSYSPISISLEHLVRKNATDRARQIINARAEGLNANIRRLYPGTDGAAFLHLLRDARAINILATYFPAVALSIAARPRAISGVSPTPTGKLHVPSATLRRQFGAVLTDGNDELKTALADEQQRAIADGRKPLRLKDIVPAYLDQLVKACGADSIITKALQADDVNHETVKTKASGLAVDAVKNFNVAAAYNIEADFSFLYEAVGRGRFALTILAAAATETGALTHDTVVHVRSLDPDKVVNFLRDVCRDLTGGNGRSPDEATLARVLAFYADRHDRRSELPELCDFNVRYGSLNEAGLTELRSPNGWRLQQELIWHMAVVGQPVEAEVLVHAPRVMDTCKKMLGTKWTDALALDLVKAALDLLVHRCLTFRIEAASANDNPYAGPDGLMKWRTSRNDNAALKTWLQEFNSKNVDGARAENASKPAWRFTIHRSLQRAVLKRMNALVEEPAAVDHFSLTQYMTQPNDMPRMSREAFSDIRKLVSAWTGLPDRLDVGKSPYDIQRDIDGDASKQLRAKQLRATLGVVRSIYSAGVVARFDEFVRETDNDKDAPEGGFLESYRRLIRWMLLEAGELKGSKAGLVGLAGETEVKPDAHAPFLAEELVWLFNECGVVSYTQGHLADAEALFGLASEAALRFEFATDHGAMRTRIHMNTAYLGIERGRSREVQREMTAIMARKDEHPVLRLCAQGMLGLIDHLAGNLAKAEEHYTYVIPRLIELERARSAAIFSRHLADLYRVQGPEFFPKARKAIDEAIAGAVRDGHEDIRQHALLSEIHLSMLEGIAEPLLVQRQIDSVITYGRVMGAPRLVADGLLLRGVLQLRQGDTRDAARVLVQGIAIAGECDNKLAQVKGLMLLSEAYEKRMTIEDRSAANVLLKRALELAGRCDYANAKASIAQSLSRRGIS